MPDIRNRMVVALDIHCEEHLEEPYLDLTLDRAGTLTQPSQDHLRFWSPRKLRIAPDDRPSARADSTLTVRAQGDGISVRGRLRSSPAAWVSFAARAVEAFLAPPVRWDLVIDEFAGLCLWNQLVRHNRLPHR
jgi:hypothetical protein